MSPEEARAARNSLRIIYVASFQAPAGTSNGEWCYEGSNSDTTSAFLIKGGGMMVGSHQSYVNMKLHRMLVTDGKRVLHSQRFTT